jgi:hypothetical protein
MSYKATLHEIYEISDSGLFDHDYYLHCHVDVAESGLDPLTHYCNFGWREGRKPNPYFDSVWYLEHHSDVVSADINPLLHYIRRGDREGRRPSLVFDSAWYRAAYSVPLEQLALGHFLTHRHGGRTLPSPELYSALHTSPFSELAAAEKDPFCSFAPSTTTISAQTIERDLIYGSGLFDENYYLLNGSDLFEANIDPTSHFCRWGWREHRKPNIYFDVAWYLATNPRIARLSINPLAHYLLEGEHVGRRPIIYFDPVWYRETYDVRRSESALAHYLVRRRHQIVSPNPLFDSGWYMEHYGAEVGMGRDPFAHYLHAGTYRHVNPSPSFNAAAYRRRFLGRPRRLFAHLADPHRDNPLVHYLRSAYQ